MQVYYVHFMDPQIAFGHRVKTIRLSRGYSQEHLGERARLHRTYVGGVERGERNVSLLNIWRLADALDVEPSVFFKDDNDPSRRRTSRGTKRFQ